MIWPILILFVAGYGAWWWYTKKRKQAATDELIHPFDPADYLSSAQEKRAREQRAQALASRPPEEIAQAMLDKTLARCMDKHRFALSALLYIAASDGRVSRQELRVIIGFCQSNGTDVDPKWEDASEFLNAGATIQADVSEAVARNNISNLADKPMAYRGAFLGAAEAIVALNKTTTAPKERLLEQARQLVR